MLVLCVKIINHGTSKLKIIIERGAGLKPKNGGKRISKIGSEHDEIIDAKDTYPVRTIVAIAMTRQNRKTEGNKAIITPPSVPTPFPPLNLLKIV